MEGEMGGKIVDTGILHNDLKNYLKFDLTVLVGNSIPVRTSRKVKEHRRREEIQGRRKYNNALFSDFLGWYAIEEIEREEPTQSVCLFVCLFASS